MGLLVYRYVQRLSRISRCVPPPRLTRLVLQWPPTYTQQLPLDSSGVEHLNRLAWPILQAKNVSVLDAYWLSLARPDHRQPVRNNNIGGRLVHAGPEVYSVLMRMWVMFVLESINPNYRQEVSAESKL